MTTRDPVRGPAADPLASALRALPRQAPVADFTERVLERLDRIERASAGAGRRLPAARSARRLAAAASLAAAILSGLVWAAVSVPRAGTGGAPAPEAAARSARLETLAAERARLAAELAELRRLAEEPVPLLYLGGDEDVDLVLDLGRLAREHPSARAVPAAYRLDGRR